MEVKINKEIQSYSESMFFGLSMRQCGFSLAAMLVAVGLYFLLKPYVGTETVSWMCILGAAPFAAIILFIVPLVKRAYLPHRKGGPIPNGILCRPGDFFLRIAVRGL